MTNIELRNILSKNGTEVLKNFSIGEKKTSPDQKGCYATENGWYLYEVDDHAQCVICGPFDDNAIVYACALKLHISKQFQEYRFSDQDRETYLHVHIHERK